MGKINLKKKVVFLFGAGASAEAGVCTADQITEILVNYGSYCPSSENDAIENVVRYIQVRIADYFQIRASEVNFEYLLGSLMELSKRSEVPIVPLLGEGDSLISRLENKISLDAVVYKLFSLLREMVSIKNPIDYLIPLKRFLLLSKPIDIFSLNYDLSLETAFDLAKIQYTTGYRKRNNKPAIWDPREFKNKNVNIRIFKPEIGE